MLEKYKPSVIERRNWGYWDGVNDRLRHKRPEWEKGCVYRCKHPFDRSYGEAYWIGFYDEPQPNKADIR